MLNPTPSALIPRPRVPLDEKIAWTVREVAEATGLSETFVKELTKQGKFTPSKAGKRTLYDPRQVQRALFGN